MEYILKIAEIAEQFYENGRKTMTFTELGDILGIGHWQAGSWVARAWKHYENEGDTYTASCIMFVFRYKGE